MSALVSEVTLARRVGAITLVVLALAIAGFVFLDGVTLRSPTRIRVLFKHTTGLREQAALMIAGQRIGRIDSIALVPHGADGPLAGEIGVVVTVAIDPDEASKVPAASEIFVAARGPLAEKYLEVAPPRGDPGPPVHDGTELRGIDPPTLDRVLHHTWSNMMTFQAFVAAVKPEALALRRELARLRAELATLSTAPDGLDTLVTETRALLDAADHIHEQSLGGSAGIARLAATIATARRTLTETRAALDTLAPRADALLAGLSHARAPLTATTSRALQTLSAARTALATLDPLLAGASDLVRRLSAGEGSLMLLMRDPEFPEDAKDLGKILKRRPWKLLETPGD